LEFAGHDSSESSLIGPGSEKLQKLLQWHLLKFSKFAYYFTWFKDCLVAHVCLFRTLKTYILFSLLFIKCVASSLLSLAYIFEPASCMADLTSLSLSLQENLDIAKKFGLHPVSLAIGLILLPLILSVCVSKYILIYDG
jgi:hypothetical protein